MFLKNQGFYAADVWNMNIHMHTFPWIHVSKYIQKCTNNHTSVDTRGWFPAPSPIQNFSSMLQFSTCIPLLKKKLPKWIAWTVFSFADRNCYAKTREQLLRGLYLWTCSKVLNFEKENYGGKEKWFLLPSLLQQIFLLFSQTFRTLLT